jgi:hypothetical protein
LDDLPVDISHIQRLQEKELTLRHTLADSPVAFILVAIGP